MRTILCAAVCLWSFAAQAGVEVIDGDSLRIDGRNIRLEGIDAPEYNQVCRDAEDQPYECGQKAKKFLSKLVKDGVRCEKQTTDIYRRDVSVCYAGNINVNRQMVLAGWAVAYTRYFPDFAADENVARREKRGVWSGRFIRPDIYRALEADKERRGR